MARDALSWFLGKDLGAGYRGELLEGTGSLSGRSLAQSEAAVVGEAQEPSS